MLQHWWANYSDRNAHTVYAVPTGRMRVYARRNSADPAVIEIANVSTISGYGAARSLYRTFLADIPAIAENILNPELDKMLDRWGWDFAYRDLLGTPTRVNKAFQRMFPQYDKAHSAFAAILLAKRDQGQ